MLKHLFVWDHLNNFEDFKLFNEFVKQFWTDDDSKLWSISKLTMVLCLLYSKVHLFLILFKWDNHWYLRSVNWLVNIWLSIFLHIFFHRSLILIPFDFWVNVINWAIFNQKLSKISCVLRFILCEVWVHYSS